MPYHRTCECHASYHELGVHAPHSRAIEDLALDDESASLLERWESIPA